MFFLVRMLCEELQLLQEQGSHVGEVVKPIDQKKVLVKVHPEGKFVVDIDISIKIEDVSKLELFSQIFLPHMAKLPTVVCVCAFIDLDCVPSMRMCIMEHSEQWFPTGGSWPQSWSRRSGYGFANSSLTILLKNHVFASLNINVVCYISKLKTRIDFCEVHITFITFPNCCSFYYTVSIDLIVETHLSTRTSERCPLMLRLCQPCKQLSCCESLPGEIPTKHNWFFIVTVLYCIHYFVFVNVLCQAHGLSTK